MISLLIPTLNRSGMLIKQLRYYADVGFQGRIFIGDSSGQNHIERTKNVIKELEGELDVVHQEYPGLLDAACTQKLLNLVKTPYAAFIADDDYFVPAGLEECRRFLENQPEYSAAHGTAALVTLGSNGSGPQIQGAGYYRQQVLEADTGSRRLLDHLGNYAPTVFGLHRVQSLRVMYERADAMRDRGFAGEMTPSSLTAVLGKIKKLDCLHLVRQAHQQQYPQPSKFDWITSQDWLPSYHVFHEHLSGVLAQQDNIDLEEAQTVVKHAFWLFLANTLSRQAQQRAAPKSKRIQTNLRKTVMGVPGLRRAWRKVRPHLPGDVYSLSLAALLRPDSQYHADFMPVYRALSSRFDPTKDEMRG